MTTENLPTRVRSQSTTGPVPSDPEVLARVLSKLDELEQMAERLASKTPAEKAWEWAFRATVPIAIALAGWAVSLSDRVALNEKRVTVLEATHFTAADAALLAGEIRTQMAIPPAWVQSGLGRVEVKLDRIGEQMADLSNRITRVEAERGR